MLELTGIATLGIVVGCVTYFQRRIHQLEAFITDMKERDEEGFERLLEAQREEAELWRRLYDSWDEVEKRLQNEE
ncbi:hypothetical protein H6G04_27055 [Calothrix membranacea FACHB-236]|nr:hypothetical protein [Calothrix membranacea FACHB-236]